MITTIQQEHRSKLFLQSAQQICYCLFALISMVDCSVVLRCACSRVRRPVVLGAALLVAATAAYGLAATDARAGAKTWEMAQADPAAAGSPLAPAAPESGAQQAATTDQAADAAASATQQQPQNMVITIRINSPGVDGPITQTNVIVAGSSGSNAASTTQNGVPGTGGAAPSQNADTGQQAGSSATASQDGAGNLVVIVRINSPGDNGPISQTNAVVAGANAANTSTTTQGQPTAGSAPAATPASGGAVAPRRSARKPAPDPPRKQPAAARPAARPAAPAPAAAPAVRHESSTTAAVDRAHAKHPAVARAHGKATRTGASSFDRGSAATPLNSVAGGAADVFHAVAPPTPIANVDSADVSQSVLYSLLVVLAAVAAFLLWPQRPEWLRPFHARTRLRG
jgi:hypothetical protein